MKDWRVRDLFLVIIIVTLLGCSATYMKNTNTIEDTKDIDTFQFIITFSSDNEILLREAAIKYNEKSEQIRSKDKDYYNNQFYQKYRQWALLLDQKATMIESGLL